MDFAGENVGQLEQIAAPIHFTPVQFSMPGLAHVQPELQAVVDIEVALEVQLALADVAGATQSQ